jgi:hypothetical protein
MYVANAIRRSVYIVNIGYSDHDVPRRGRLVSLPTFTPCLTSYF